MLSLLGLPREFPRHGHGSRWAQPSAAPACALSLRRVSREVLSLGWPLVWPGMKASTESKGNLMRREKIQSLRLHISLYYQGGFLQGFDNPVNRFWLLMKHFLPFTEGSTLARVTDC